MKEVCPVLASRVSICCFVSSVLIIFTVYGKGNETMSMHLETPVFGNNEAIPKKYSCDGENISPPLEWSNVPDSAKSIVLIVDDPDAPIGTFVHWVCYDIPVSVKGLGEAVPQQDSLPQGGFQGKNDFNKNGYGGPCPPGGTHRYFFKLYALDTALGLSSGKTKDDIETAMEGHVLSTAQLIGTYSR